MRSVFRLYCKYRKSHLDPLPLGVENKSKYTVLKNACKMFILMTLENTGGSKFKVVEN